MSIQPNAMRLLQFGVFLALPFLSIRGGSGEWYGPIDSHATAKGAPILNELTPDRALPSDGGQAGEYAPVDPGWWKRVAEKLACEEYEASVSESGLQAPNRAHNFRIYFRPEGIELIPRVGQEDGRWSLTWRTTGWGREACWTSILPGAVPPVPQGARVAYHHPGFQEWYENGSDGLEQGFTIENRPGGRGPLRIAGLFGGRLEPEILPERGAIDLHDPDGGPVLRYDGLRVVDAGGIEVPARLALTGRELAILIDDQDATYPLTVDPLLTSPSWIVESNQTNALFGISVGTAGDVNGDGYSDVIVGANEYDNGQTDEGRAYVYLGSSSGLATTAAWTGESNQAGAQFGWSVGTAGDVNHDGYTDVIVGALRYDNGQTDEGRVYVFHGSATGLSSAAAWTAEGDQASALFGKSVGTAGDINGDLFADVIVGANMYDNGQTDEGRVWVFLGSSSGVSSTASWTAEGGQSTAYFGTSVGSAGDVNGDGYGDVIVGSSSYTNGQSDEGRAYVFLGSGSGLSASAVWYAESDQSGASFGNSVATAGDVNGDGYCDVIVGALGYDNGSLGEGRAYVYLGSSGGPSGTPAWIAESDRALAEFGYSVMTAGDVNGDGYADVIVGASAYENGETGEGGAFLYQGSASGLLSIISWTAEGDQAGAYFGYAVATAGDVNGDGYSDVIVGAHAYDSGQANEGRAYVYHGSPSGLAATSGWVADGGQESAWFGGSVGVAGDVNGDGYSDVIIGATGYDNGQSEEGAAFVFHGSSTGPSAIPDWRAEGNQDGAIFGYSVGTAGDVNGDGYSDVIVGALFADNGQAAEGRVYVYHGSSTGLQPAPSWAVEGDQEGALMGGSVGTAGDVNGDGYSDVIVGAHGYDNGEDGEGRAFVYHGSAAGLAATPSWTSEGNQASSAFGVSVATAGDVNRDGYSDVIIGAQYYDNGQVDEGRAFLYLGSSSGLAVTPGWTAEGNQASAHFAQSVSTAGDVNGDGYSDVIIGADDYDNGQVDEGQAYLYPGSSSGLAVTPGWTAEGNQASAWFGRSVGVAGDVNGDGYSDVIVGASGYDNGQAGEGRAYLYEGSSAGLSATAAWVEEIDVTTCGFGGSVGGSGDTNGDGYADVIIGAVNYSNGQSWEGGAFVYFGNAGDGLDRRPRQIRTDDSAPIAALGASDSGEGFLLKTVGRTPAGRGNVRLQYEVKPLGAPFDGSGLVTGPPVNTGSPGSGGSTANLSGLVSGLTPNAPYRWRLRTLTDSPLFPGSPWFSLSYNCASETDLRTADSNSGIDGGGGASPILWLDHAAPNPFGAATTVTYALPENGGAHLAIYDPAGRLVRVLANGEEQAGPHTVRWDGRDDEGRPQPTGVYFVRLMFGDRKEAIKVLLTK